MASLNLIDIHTIKKKAYPRGHVLLEVVRAEHGELEVELRLDEVRAIRLLQIPDNGITRRLNRMYVCHDVLFVRRSAFPGSAFGPLREPKPKARLHTHLDQIRFDEMLNAA
jgi:hypothetical protein